MNKKSKKIIILLSLALILLTSGIGGTTYAKYRTSVKGGEEVEIAKWSFKVNEESEQIETISLADTIIGDVPENLIAKGKIAPGIQGQFTLNIDATESEVGLTYNVKFINEENKPTHLIFTYGGNTFNSLEKIQSYLEGTIDADEEDKTREITIGWEWEYETGIAEGIKANDIIDTQEGIADLDYTFNIVVTGTQIPFTVE